MRHLFYTNYRSGQSGLSNAIMSTEIGVALAHLTNRFLVLDGNCPPPANLVRYDGRVNDDRPSRVTDLIDIPVPWGEPQQPRGASAGQDLDLERLDSLELTDRSLADLVFYFPQTLDLSSEDAQSFARGRDHWVTITEERDRIPVLRLSEQPLVPRTDPQLSAHAAGLGRQRRNNLGFYSYEFYLNDETRRSTHRVLERMRAKEPFAELAKRVAGDIGSFNAVHLRRGDFKVTYGVTTLERQPWEAIEALDHVFDRKDPLVIVTDDREDPFFREIERAYPHHLYVDWHILDAYEAEFARLPQRDSLSLAYLSQLVAAESASFIGTMTSTFTSIIQRYRGNRGKDEPFRFLWNELPEPDAPTERGRHAISHCIPLDRGVMVEEREGRYSWNRVSQRLNPAWMREWPESFLTRQTLTTGALAGTPNAPTPSVRTAIIDARPASVVYLTFENLQVAIRSRDADFLYHAGLIFGARSGETSANVIADLDVVFTGGRYAVLRDGERLGEASHATQLGQLVKTLVVPVFTNARRQHSWLRGAAFGRGGRAMVVAGDLGNAEDSVVGAMERDGWDLLEDGVIAIRIRDRVVLPFGARTGPGGLASGKRIQTPLARLVVATRRLNARDFIVPLSPAVAVATLIEASLDFRTDPDRAAERLCRLVEQQAVAQLSFSRAGRAAELLSRWADASDGASRASQVVSIVSEPPVVVEPRAADTSIAHDRLRRPRYVIVDDFLCPAEHRDLLLLATASEQSFKAGTVVGDNPEHRQNLVIPSFGDSAHARLIQNRVLVWYPLLARMLGVTVVPVGVVESQLTAARGRQFYKLHADLGPDCPRELSCIYYMHRQPRGFAGGELRLYDCIEQGGEPRPAETFEVVAPISNRLVVFPSGEFHEAMPVRCPSGDFADSRFAITTWIHRAGTPDPEARFGWGHFRCGVVAPQFASLEGAGESVP